MSYVRGTGVGLTKEWSVRSCVLLLSSLLGRILQEKDVTQFDDNGF